MKKKNLFKNPIFVVLLIIGAVLLINLMFGNMFRATSKTVAYSDFCDDLAAGKIDKLMLSGTQVEYTLKEEKDGEAEKSVFGLTEKRTYKALRVDSDTSLISRLLAHGVQFEYVSQTSLSDILYIVFTVALPMLLMVLLFVSVFRGMKKGDGLGGGFGFGKTNAKLFTLSDVSKKFSDVAGQDEAKQQLVELVDFLHQPEKYRAIGAKLPKGALLVGPPGTGKTLLAQAVAGEANVPFFFVSGSAFVEMFVGAGAARVRDLFKQANEKAPCIIFIDEIDAIGKKRDTTGFAGNDEREQSLNQLLAEMDGFDPGKGIVVLGATNRPEILDDALLRPGRFDRRIPVELPDLKGRESILKVHAKPITMGKDTDLAAIAKATAGASGADLANIINEAALRAVREKHTAVTQEDLEACVETVIAGNERKSMVIPEKEKKLVAYHEIGHALAAALQKNTSPVTKITIVPRTSGALGYTMQVDEEEHVLMSRNELLDRLCVLCAGRAAEEVACGDCTTGAANDIQQATSLAKAMVTRYGMSENFGMMMLETQTSVYLGNEGHLTCAPDTAAQIDIEVKAVLKKAYDKAVEMLTENRDKLDALTKVLYEKENLTGEEFMEILNGLEKDEHRETEEQDNLTTGHDGEPQETTETDNN